MSEKEIEKTIESAIAHLNNAIVHLNKAIKILEEVKA